MIRTVISIFISLALLLGVSFFEANYVKETFEDFENRVLNICLKYHLL